MVREGRMRFEIFLRMIHQIFDENYMYLKKLNVKIYKFGENKRGFIIIKAIHDKNEIGKIGNSHFGDFDNLCSDVIDIFDT